MDNLIMGHGNSITWTKEQIEAYKNEILKRSRGFTSEETKKYKEALVKIATKKETKLLEYKGLDLIVQRYIRMGQSQLLKNNTMNANILGTVNKLQLPTGQYMYPLEPGAYKVEFNSQLPFKWNEPSYFYLKQDKLFDAGMHLAINLNPFCGLLNVEYKALIEEGLVIGTLLYGVIPHEYTDLLEWAEKISTSGAIVNKG